MSVSPAVEASLSAAPRFLDEERRSVESDAVRARADGLVAQLTLEEKVGMVSSYFPLLSSDREEKAMPLCSGYTPGIERLGIPSLRISDASLGVANALNARVDDTATALPSALTMGATFDVELTRIGGAMIGSEARAKTFNVLLAGGINLVRDPWAGRNFEYFSEDALLSGVLGAAAVQGVQSNSIASTVKHYVLNPQETGRMIVDARIGAAALRESDMLAFEIAIEGGRPASVMTAYNKVNGDWMGENAPLVAGVLKSEWKFPGWVMSDWGGTHSTAKAALAGLDQESGVELDKHLNGAVFFTDGLCAAVASGDVPEGRLDDMVARILVGLIGCGAFDHPVPEVPQPVDEDANALIAQRIAEAGIVLLRNERRVLPLRRDVGRVVVIGGHADVGVLSGGGSSQVRSNGGAPIEIGLESGDAAWFCRRTFHASSPLKALQAAAPDARIEFYGGEDHAHASRLAAEADVAIVFATQWRTEAVDLQSLALDEGQDELISAVAEANPRTVVVLETGGAVLMPWLQKVPAVLAAWYPGQRGGEAIARLLFGDVAPSGRLPICFPVRDGDAPRPLPCGVDEMLVRDAAKLSGDTTARIAPFFADYMEGANVGYRWYEATERVPQFPFGFGLSYTSFSYSNLEIIGGTLPCIDVDVTNTGSTAGVDVPQVYVRAVDSSGIETWRLAGFHRVALEPGSTRRVRITLEARAFSRWDEASARWTRSDRLPLAVGRSAGELLLSGELTATHTH